MEKSRPFIFGSQYYRAPTPEPECWESDLQRMKELGFNSVKYFVQWRWSHRGQDRFYFDDLDRLMELAHRNGLQVTLNILCDMSPLWLFEKYPDARQILNDGRIVEQYEVAHRQIGGHPGPCYNHPGALAERVKFMEAVVEHFRPFPAMTMWDVWNEPELCFPQRTPDIKTLACYCPHCRAGFARWLQRKYASLDKLNQVWGRCYEEWDQVEPPRSGGTITDFVDWREFHVDTMTNEAAWRLDVVARKDPERVRYLHVVPNVMAPWNAVTCATDDFELAKHCEVFAATMNGGPLLASQVLSAARGKLCYNVESHINQGMTNRHQRILGLADVLRDFLPQIGLGIRGFLFWQYRPEVLGYESPAWGLVDLEGGDRPVTRAVSTFWRSVAPHAESLLASHPPRPEIGIWKSRKNEIFHFAIHREFRPLADSADAYLQACYWNNLRFLFVNSEILARGELAGMKLLIMPSPYYLTEEEARGLDAWVRDGGVLLCEAHLAGYNGTTGRHSRVLPGCGLAESWGIRETDSTAAGNLSLERAAAFAGAPADSVKKTIAELAAESVRYFPIRLASGATAWGALRYAILSTDGCDAEGSFDATEPCMVSRKVGKGMVFYCGANLGLGAKRDPPGLVEVIRKAASRAGASATLGATVSSTGKVHVDALEDQTGVRFVMILNGSDSAQRLAIDGSIKAKGLFSGLEIGSGVEIELAGGFADLFVAGR